MTDHALFEIEANVGPTISHRPTGRMEIVWPSTGRPAWFPMTPASLEYLVGRVNDEIDARIAGTDPLVAATCTLVEVEPGFWFNPAQVAKVYDPGNGTCTVTVGRNAYRVDRPAFEVVALLNGGQPS